MQKSWKIIHKIEEEQIQKSKNAKIKEKTW